jgi:hypothetical protein
MNKAFLPGILILALSAPIASAKSRKLNGKFDRADINSDNQLDALEFQATQTKKLSVAYSLFRFQRTDTNDDNFVSLEEFLASRGGITGGKPTKIDLFLLADADDNDVLDPEEYADTLSPGVPWPKVLKAFAKRDKDDNGELTPREFGIRRGFPFPF